MFTSPPQQEKKPDGADKISLQNWNTGYTDVIKTKKTPVAPHITHLMCSLVLLLKIFLQLVANCNRCLPSLLTFTSFLCITFGVLWSYRNHVKKISGILRISRIQWEHACRFWKRSPFFGHILHIAMDIAYEI